MHSDGTPIAASEIDFFWICGTVVAAFERMETRNNTTALPRYPDELTQPMRDELTSVGFEDIRSAAEVEKTIRESADSTLMVVVNSVCGCAAGNARPGVIKSMANAKRPAHLITVFAGMEHDAVAAVREYFEGYQSSSPQIALFSKGRLVLMLERSDIQHRSADDLAHQLREAFDKYCA